MIIFEMGESSKWVRRPIETLTIEFPNNGFCQGKGHALPPVLLSVAESALVAPVGLLQNQPFLPSIGAMNPSRINNVKILTEVFLQVVDCVRLPFLSCYMSVIVHLHA